MTTPILKEAERLHKLGFAILWIKPKSKAPVKNKWTTGPREGWDALKQSYKPGYNLGVRLGTPSQINGKYLSVIDIDVKSLNTRHQVEAIEALEKLFPTLPRDVVQVASGRGNGSSHIYIVTSKPAAPQILERSKDKIKVLMPSSPINQSQRDLLSEEDLNEGYRLRPAWEVAVMGEGQQVVLPPSTHPDTRREYLWKHRIERATDLHEFSLPSKEKDTKRSATNDWEPVEVDLVLCDLSEETVNLILFAECEDRSATLFKVVIDMIKESFNDRQIMSVLTDLNYELAKTAYDHAKTESRKIAANWVYNYTIKKARSEVDARFQFNEEVEVSYLDDAQAERQIIELGNQDWRMALERYGPKGANANKPKSTLKNILLILENEIAVDIFKRDIFAYREFYGHSTPWGGVRDKSLTDDDVLKIMVWLEKRYRFEAKKSVVIDSMSFISERNSFDPIKDWLEQLPEWDGVNRLDHWLAKNFQAQGDTQYLAQVFRKWMVAMVMRIYVPGAKFDWMPIFEGKQGYGKSSFGRILVGDKYFVDWLPDLSDKDSALALQGIWSVELGELASLRKNEIESIKAFITRTIDKVRPPYGHRVLEIPRRCVFFGTTNADTYLRDDTGNRRFKPVKVGQLDFDVLEAERDQLFAEALFIFNNGFEEQKTMDIEGDAKRYEAQIQSEKMVEDESTFMIESLEKFITDQVKKPSEERTFDFFKFKLTDLFNEFNGPLGGWGSDSRNLVFAAKAIKALGGEKRFIKGKTYWKVQVVGDLKHIPPPRTNGKSLIHLDT